MALPILPQALPAGASPDNEYVRQASGRVLRIDRAKCFFPSACPGCANCDTLCEVEQVVEKAREFVEASRSTATRRAYASDWRDFETYCKKRGLNALPATPQTLTLYLTDLAERAKFATIKRRLAAISQMHKERGLESPTAHEIVRRVVRGIGRTIGSAQAKKSALTLDHLRAMLLEIRGDDLKAKRDRAIILLGFAAALRRSELVALNVDDLTFCREGLRLAIRWSKTDQGGNGAEVVVPFVPNKSLCAVRAIRQWLDASGISEGPVFRSFSLQRRISERALDGQDVANLVQKLARNARLDGDFGAHSLRAGFVTVAAQAKVSLDAIARTTRHKSLSVLMGYVRPAQAFDDVALTSMIS
jgi:integrase